MKLHAPGSTATCSCLWPGRLPLLLTCPSFHACLLNCHCLGLGRLYLSAPAQPSHTPQRAPRLPFLTAPRGAPRHRRPRLCLQRGYAGGQTQLTFAQMFARCSSQLIARDRNVIKAFLASPRAALTFSRRQIFSPCCHHPPCFPKLLAFSR